MSESPPASGLTPIADALARIAERTRRLEVVRVPLIEALGLTLAEAVATDLDAPPFDKAMMDGFAVRSTDFTGSGAAADSGTQTPKDSPTAHGERHLTRLRIVGELAAGEWAARTLGAGEAMRINTGAPMPPGADAVIMIERVEISPDGREVITAEQPRPEEHVAPRGSDAAAGQVVLEAGTRLGAAQIAAAAAAGAAQVSVYRRPRLAILVTGNELVPVSQQPAGGQIRNSNGPCLAALAREAGCEVIDLGVARDEPAELRARIEAGLRADVLCLSGGVSMGQHDYVPQVLRQTGVGIAVQKIAIRPGKPTIFGIGPGGQAVFGLPGNPVSAYVCFVVFVRAALAAMQGRAAGWPMMVAARLAGKLKAAGARAEWIPAVVTREGIPAAVGASKDSRTSDLHDGAREDARGSDIAGGICVRAVRWTGSGDVFGLGRSNALIYREPHAPACQTGDIVAVTLTGPDLIESL